MTENKFTSDHDQSVQDGLLNKEMDRRSFLGKTTKMAGVALGATLLGPLNALPADAASRSSIMNSNGAKPDLVFPVISDVHIYTDNDKNEYNPHDPAEVKALENYWNLQTDFVDNFQGFFHIPVLILLFFSYYLWIKNGKNKTQKILISLSIIPIGLIYLWLTIMIGMLGYQP